MMASHTFLIAGGGTGGHVIPALAVARELRQRGHEAIFAGTREGMEARLVPQAGFAIEWVEIGGLKGVGLGRRLRTLLQLPVGIATIVRLARRRHPAAVFSMGGFVAGPVVLAALLCRLPLVVMEPNAVPGFTNRRIARAVARALVSFSETSRYFPAGRTEVTGLPVRADFFAIQAKPREPALTILITGGSRGSRTLNRAARESWPLFRAAGRAVRIIHQTGAAEFAATREAFATCGLEGEVVEFIDDMAAVFSRADLVVCRSGAGAVSELAAAGKPSILVPFPFATDQHQLHNAEALAAAGAARLVLDQELDGQRLFREVSALAGGETTLETMGRAARSLARPGAAGRVADILEELASGSERVRSKAGATPAF
ncbi:MAG: undecaprenyldiphospho-muramoylpentapeptide beta-N-acetylglucosaminyltransferase [Bryobacterales bacterium]|nr:undecaprenyldiphospho-muramoylpentapeptide beta-N-acetylglucosaminyltransferase [Bryobacterales bacterium]